MAKINKKKTLSVISFVLSVAIFALAITVFVTSVASRAKNGRAEFFGYSFAVVVTDSMSPEIKVGDLIIVKSCNITEMAEGQNAVFIGLSGTYKDKSIVHRVIGIHDVIDETSGEITGICLETKGINNSLTDDDYVYADNFIGKEIYHSTALGKIVTFFRNPINWIFLIVVCALVWFAVKQSIKIVKLAKNKDKAADKQDDITEDKDNNE